MGFACCLIEHKGLYMPDVLFVLLPSPSNKDSTSYQPFYLSSCLLFPDLPLARCGGEMGEFFVRAHCWCAFCFARIPECKQPFCVSLYLCACGRQRGSLGSGLGLG